MKNSPSVAPSVSVKPRRTTVVPAMMRPHPDVSLFSELGTSPEAVHADPPGTGHYHGQEPADDGEVFHELSGLHRLLIRWIIPKAMCDEGGDHGAPGDQDSGQPCPRSEYEGKATEELDKGANDAEHGSERHAHAF